MLQHLGEDEDTSSRTGEDEWTLRTWSPPNRPYARVYVGVCVRLLRRVRSKNLVMMMMVVAVVVANEAVVGSWSIAATGG